MPQEPRHQCHRQLTTLVRRSSGVGTRRVPLILANVVHHVDPIAVAKLCRAFTQTLEAKLLV